MTVFTRQPGLLANLAGVAGGDIGSGGFAGEVFKMNTDAAGVTEGVAFYPFTAPRTPSRRWSMSGHPASDLWPRIPLAPSGAVFTGVHWGRRVITNGANRP